MVLQFTIDRGSDPERSKLRELLETQFTYERMRAGRSLCVHLLAAVGGLIWLEAIWPALLPSEFQLFTLVLWGGLLLIALCIGVTEYISRRRLSRYGVSLAK